MRSKLPHSQRPAASETSFFHPLSSSSSSSQGGTIWKIHCVPLQWRVGAWRGVLNNDLFAISATSQGFNSFYRGEEEKQVGKRCSSRHYVNCHGALRNVFLDILCCTKRAINHIIISRGTKTLKWCQEWLIVSSLGNNCSDNGNLGWVEEVVERGCLRIYGNRLCSREGPVVSNCGSNGFVSQSLCNSWRWS